MLDLAFFWACNTKNINLGEESIWKTQNLTFKRKSNLPTDLDQHEKVH